MNHNDNINTTKNNNNDTDIKGNSKNKDNHNKLLYTAYPLRWGVGWVVLEKKKIEYLKQDYEEKHIQPVSLSFCVCLRSTNNNYDFNIIKTTMEIRINSSYIQCRSWMTWPRSIKLLVTTNNTT